MVSLLDLVFAANSGDKRMGSRACCSASYLFASSINHDVHIICTSSSEEKRGLSIKTKAAEEYFSRLFSVEKIDK